MVVVVVFLGGWDGIFLVGRNPLRHCSGSIRELRSGSRELSNRINSSGSYSCVLRISNFTGPCSLPMPVGVEDPDSICVVELPGLLLDQAGPRVDLLRCRVVCASK